MEPVGPIYMRRFLAPGSRLIIALFKNTEERQKNYEQCIAHPTIII
jgi:hypothetical protein